ncbi:helix-turn-helix domain-containing protein [Segatella copri]|uniref:helix-turn-helix domain-containing protein n=1 Tax=Segatella copri TaxID=165179 RepID=UPI002FEF97CC
MEMNEESILAWNIIEKTNANLFLTGKAGTGKTTFLKRLKELSPKRMIVLAPTGIAAINAGGMTIHSFFQLPFSPYVPGTTFGSGEQKRYQFSKLKRNIIRSIDLLVIDEISMVRSDLLDAVDSVLRQYRKRHDLPFGGVQLLMIGDLQQLAPVVTPQEEHLLGQHYDTPFFFSSNALKQVGYLTIELKKVYRQQDEQFISLLNQIRENKASEATLQALNQRYIPNFVPPKEGNYIRLTTHNAPAQYINEQQLAALPAQSFSFTADIEGDFPETSYPADFKLTLKPGAQVMFIKNDPQHRFYNGMIGEVIGVRTDEDGSKITVRSKDSGEEFDLEKMEWTNAKYTLNEKTKEIEETVEGKFMQYPLRLAWAITIHKSQGLTFEHAIIDASHSFTHGQTYVALSRCKTLEGMVLSQPLSRGAIISSQTVDAFTSQLAAPSQEQISSLELQYIIYCISELFDFYSIRASYEHLMRCLVEFFNGKYPRVVSEYQKLQVVLKSLIAVSDKFRVQYTGMLARNPDVRQAELQDRIHKGAMYFLDKIGILSDLIRKSNLDTDNKVARKQFEDRFSVFSEDVKLKERLLKYECSAEFTVTDYLKKKAQFLLLDADASSDSGSGRKSRRQKKPNEPKVPKTPTREISYNLYKQGMTLEQIAAERGLVKDTIAGHLASYVKEGKIGLRALISSAHEKKIRDFMKAHPELEHFSEIKEALGAGIDYYEIKLVYELMEGE